MVAPMFGPTEASSSSSDAPQEAMASPTKNEKRREEILSRLVSDASEVRMQGNKFFKDTLYNAALTKYSDAIHTLQKVPLRMAGPDLVKVLNNRGRVYVKLAMMGYAEADASEVLSMEGVENAARAAAFLVRYHARLAAGDTENAVQDLQSSADLGNIGAQKALIFVHESSNKQDRNSASISSDTSSGGKMGDEKRQPEYDAGGSSNNSSSAVDGPGKKYSTCEGASSDSGRVASSGVGQDQHLGLSPTSPTSSSPHKPAATVAATGRRASNNSKASERNKLEARLIAGPGEELKFGGSASEPLLPWGQRPVREDVADDGFLAARFESLMGADAAVTLTSAANHVDSSPGIISGGSEKKSDRGKNGAQGAGVEKQSGVAVGLETSRTRCPPQGKLPEKVLDDAVTTTTFTVDDEANSGALPSPHPVFEHASVKRCLLSSTAHVTGMAEVVEGEKGPNCQVDCSAIAAGPCSDSAGDDAAGEGGESNGVGMEGGVKAGRGDEEREGLARGVDADAGGGRGSSSGGGGGGGSDGGEASKGGELVEDAQGPPRAKQAQDVQWLVEQAKAKPEEGDVWAVLDRQWWLRWQRYTGCDEGSPPSKDAAENPQSSRTVGSDNDGIREEGRRSSPEFAGNGNGSGQDSGVPLRERGEGVRGVGNSGVNPGGGSGDHGVGVGQEGIGVVRDGSEVGSAVESDREGMRDDDSRDVTLMPPNVNGKKSGGEGIERGGESAADPLVEADRAAGTLDKAATAAGTEALAARVHPGPIDNAGLVLKAGTPGTVPGTGQRLRLRLVRGYHFVLVPQEAWKALHAWYGGGPALPRALVRIQDSESGRVVFEPQLYPEFSLLDPVLRTVSATRPAPASSDKPQRNRNDDRPPEFKQASSSLSAKHQPQNVADSESSSNSSPANGYIANGHPPAEEKSSGSSGVPSEGEQAKEGDTGETAPVVVHKCAACERPAKRKCVICKKNSREVYYCSRECQTAHWRYHQKFCGGKGSGTGLDNAKRGKAGLENLGNTCFLNSAVQCLSHVQPLTQHILTNAFLRDLNTTNPLGTGGSLLRAYEKVLKDLWFGGGTSVSPNGLKSAIAKFAPQFNGYSQQDSQEVLSFLLDGLHEDLNRVLKKPYLTLPDGECGRPDDIIAAQSWEMFNMRDRSVLVESMYGQFKSTLECQQCGKLSRKFDEFNVMPVELLDGQRLQVVLDFAPRLIPPTTNAAAKSGTPSAAAALGGAGVNGRKPRRVGVLLARDSLVTDLRGEVAAMVGLEADEVVIVVVPSSGRAIYRILPDSAEVLPFMQGYEITAHECVPGHRHALVINRVFEGGLHLAAPEGAYRDHPLAQWAYEVNRLADLRHEDKDAPFLVSFPHNASCLRMLEVIWRHMADFVHLTKEEREAGPLIVKAGHIKVCEASDFFAPRFTQIDLNQLDRQEKADAENSVVATGIGRFIPPTDQVAAAAVLDTRGSRRQGLDFLCVNWSGALLEKMDAPRIQEPFGTDHTSVQETAQRAKRVSLQDCLEKFSVPETLCEDNSWYCGNCKELRQAVKTIQVWSLPEVLILHFKRFSHAGPNRGKVELFVDFPINGLDMSPYCRGERLEGGRPMPALYDLFAVSNHMGGMGHGHYTAFVRDWEGSGMSAQWHVCDDHDCRPVHESRIRTSHAYVLFYRRRPLC